MEEINSWKSWCFMFTLQGWLKMRQYLSNILIWCGQSDAKGKYTIGLIPLKFFTYNILFSQQNLAIILFLERLYLLQLWHLYVSSIQKWNNMLFQWKYPTYAIKMLYFNVLLRRFIFNIYCNKTINCLDINDNKFASIYQKT